MKPPVVTVVRYHGLLSLRDGVHEKLLNSTVNAQQVLQVPRRQYRALMDLLSSGAIALWLGVSRERIRQFVVARRLRAVMLEREGASDNRLLARSRRALISVPATDGVDNARVDFSFEHIR